MFFEWNDTYSVQIEQVDNEHKRLFEMLNQFYEQLREPDSNKAIPKLIQNMKKYALTHFENERRIMLACNHPQLNIHVAKHAEFVKKVEEVEANLLQGRPVMPMQLTNFIKDWLTQHIMVYDKNLAPFMRKMEQK